MRDLVVAVLLALVALGSAAVLALGARSRDAGADVARPRMSVASASGH